MDRTNGAKGSKARSRSRDKRTAGARSRSRDKRAAGGSSYSSGSLGHPTSDSYFLKVLNKRNDMQKLLGEERDAKRFFEAMEGFAEETDLLFRLDDRQSNGHAAVQKAFSIALASSDDDVLGCAVRFLGLLGSKKLNKGTMVSLSFCLLPSFRLPNSVHTQQLTLLRPSSFPLGPGRVRQ